MRKYDIKNKRNFLIIGLISLVIIIIFSIFIYKFITMDKKEFSIETGSILLDYNKDVVVAKDKAILKTKWNHNYYLINDDETVLLGMHALCYNEQKHVLKLYGKYYEVNKDNVKVYNDETIINNLNISKLYKLEDRKYLIVDSLIESSDNAFSTSNYLLIELDKSGNAVLTNNKINLKTISKTNIITSSFTFNIAEEKLIFADKEIDLGSIIGTTNEYGKDKNNTSNNTTESYKTNVGNVISPDNGLTNNNENNQGSNISSNNNETNYTITSVTGLSASLTSIDINYVIYDPNNKYTDNYVLLYKEDGSYMGKYRLKTNSTTTSIDNLDINTNYSLIFKNDYIDDDGEKSIEFYRANIHTSMPKFSISINKISLINKSISYKVSLDKEYLTQLKEGSITANISLICQNGISSVTVSKNFTSDKIPASLSGSINLPTLIDGEIITVKLNNITINNKTINTNNVYYKFKNN